MSAKNLVILGRSLKLETDGQFSAAQVYSDINSRGIGISKVEIEVILSEMKRSGLLKRTGARYQLTRKGIAVLAIERN